jgi:hypothetical protein
LLLCHIEKERDHMTAHPGAGGLVCKVSLIGLTPDARENANSLASQT